MIRIVFFHDNNWKIKGYKVEVKPEAYTAYRTQLNYLKGLLLGTRLALEEIKAYHCKTDNAYDPDACVEVYEVVVARQNKQAAAILKPLELGVKFLAEADRNIIEVLQF